MSRMARDLKIFPYGRNVAVVVSTVMEKDRQDAAQKRRAVVRIGDPFCEAKGCGGGGGGEVGPPGWHQAPAHGQAGRPWAQEVFDGCEGCLFWRGQTTLGRARQGAKGALPSAC
jgi:hypothetical protein